jgi:hypothetical protein
VKAIGAMTKGTGHGMAWAFCPIVTQALANRLPNSVI